MKKAFAALIITLCIVPLRIHSLDLEISGGAGNYAFDSGLTSSLGDEAESFQSQFYPLALVQISGEKGNFYYNMGFERDPLLRNRFFANVAINLNYFFVEAGPYLGLFNTRKLPVSPGIGAGLGFTVPGIIFIEARGSSTLAIPMDIKGNYSQLSGDISLGFWVPHVVCSLNVRARNYTVRKESNLLIEDAFSRYFFRADIYTKNVPYTMQLDLGYQSLSRSYSSWKTGGGGLVKDTRSDTLKSIFIGLEMTYTVIPVLKVYLGGEIPVYSWAELPMKDLPGGTALFQAWTGVIWTLPSKKTQR